jgi:hypothetical protein
VFNGTLVYHCNRIGSGEWQKAKFLCCSVLWEFQIKSSSRCLHNLFVACLRIGLPEILGTNLFKQLNIRFHLSDYDNPTRSH